MITHEEVLKKVKAAKAADEGNEDKLGCEALCAFAEYFAQQLDVHKEELPYLFYLTATIVEMMKYLCVKDVLKGSWLAANVDKETEDKLHAVLMKIFNIGANLNAEVK